MNSNKIANKKVYIRLNIILAIFLSIFFLSINFNHSHLNSKEQNDCQICHFNQNLSPIIIFPLTIIVALFIFKKNIINITSSFLNNLSLFHPIIRDPPIL